MTIYLVTMESWGHDWLDRENLVAFCSSYKAEQFVSQKEKEILSPGVKGRKIEIEEIELEDYKMKKKTVVISAYPCCGKTYAFKSEHYKDKYDILDSDSSQFSWIYENGNKVRNPEFPNNYIKHIKENIGKVDVIFVSSHLQVREAMEEAGIRYCTVYPKPEMLNEWVGRMYLRGNDDKFIEFQIANWDKFVNNIVNEPHGFGLLRLGNNEYIDVEFLINWR